MLGIKAGRSHASCKMPHHEDVAMRHGTHHPPFRGVRHLSHKSGSDDYGAKRLLCSGNCRLGKAHNHWSPLPEAIMTLFGWLAVIASVVYQLLSDEAINAIFRWSAHRCGVSDGVDRNCHRPTPHRFWIWWLQLNRACLMVAFAVQPFHQQFHVHEPVEDRQDARIRRPRSP
jgi:hypothetical protein